MLVHKYALSSTPDQMYDVLLYLVEREDGALLRVAKVEYYFGPRWGNIIFTSTDRSRGFPVRVSAYDRFICVATLHFVDGWPPADVFRCVDFEMGPPAIPRDAPKPVNSGPRGGPPVEIGP